MRLRFIKDYVVAIGSDWVGLVSGIASIVFLVLGFIFKLSDVTQFRYWAIAAFLCYAIASYWAWYKNRPDLGIEQMEVFLSQSISDEGGIQLVSYDVTMLLMLINRHKVDNAIRGYDLKVIREGNPSQGWPKSTLGTVIANVGKGFPDLRSTASYILKQGHPRYGWVAFRYSQVGKDFDLSFCDYVLTVTDVLGGEYKIKGELPLPSRHLGERDYLLPFQNYGED